MARRNQALVTPSVLRWGRTTLGLSPEEAARKLRVPPEKLAKWENGEERPTVAQLRRIAEAYKRPIATFFLPEPPDDPRPPKDYRQLPENVSAPLSYRLRLEIRRTHFRQSVAAELIDPAELRLLPSLGSATLEDEIVQLARRVRTELGISLEEQVSWRNPDRGLGAWTTAFEAQGILVFQTTQVEVSEMRGMSFHSPRVPAILLNGADSPNARIFSLLHELGHLLLSDEGICDLYELVEGRSAMIRTETYCNRFAATLLVPTEALHRHPAVAAHRARDDWSDEELIEVAHHFSVSTEVVLRSLVTAGKASWPSYLSRRHEFQAAVQRYRERLKRSPGGPPWYRRVIKANGRRFTRLVLSAYDDEAITGSDLSEYLGTDLRHLAKIEGEVYQPSSPESALV